MKSDSPLLARIVLGIVAAMALSIPLAITFYDGYELALLEKTAQTTDGRVTKKNCNNHGKLVYSYVVNARFYTGTGTLLGKSCDDVEVGESVNIIYSTQRPQLSRSESLASWRGNISGNLFALALASLAAAIVIFRVTRVDVDN